MRSLSKVPAQLARPIADDLNKEIQRGFDRGTDPYGKKWDGLKASTLARGRFNPPLTDTRAGRESVKIKPTGGAGLKMVIGKKYMVYHTQPKRSPRRHYVQRNFVPRDRLPDTWGAIVLAHYEAAVKKALHG